MFLSLSLSGLPRRTSRSHPHGLLTVVGHDRELLRITGLKLLVGDLVSVRVLLLLGGILSGILIFITGMKDVIKILILTAGTYSRAGFAYACL